MLDKSLESSQYILSSFLQWATPVPRFLSADRVPRFLSEVTENLAIHQL
jgi:hypothetical protein